MTSPFCLAKSASCRIVVSTATVLSLNWIHSKIISGATVCIIGLTKIPKIEFLPLDWIYRSIRVKLMNIVSHFLIEQFFFLQILDSYNLLIPAGSTAFYNAYFGRGTGPILLDDLQCGGSETRIINCPRYRSQGIGTYDGCYNGHGDDAGVRCMQCK